MRIFVFILPILFALINVGFFIFNILLINWLNDLEKNDCVCSKDWKRYFIKHWLMFLCCVIAVSILTLLLTYISGKRVVNCINIYSYVVFFMSFLNCILSIVYIKQLKDTNCNCSENKVRDVYYVYSWIIFVLNIPIFLGALYGFFNGLGYTMSKADTKSKCN